MNDNNSLAIEKGKDNIFEDLGFEVEEAAKFFNEPQPRISNLMNGDINQFSIDKLVQMIIKAGMQIRVEVITTTVA